jgi:iron complex outermembrane receptor protein
MSTSTDRNGHVSRAVKLALMAGSLPLVASQTAFAQEEEGAAELEEITVTGSRIPARNLISSSPVTTLSSDEISFQGVTRIEDMLNRLPQVYADQTSTLANGATQTATAGGCRQVLRSRPHSAPTSTRSPQRSSTASKY